MTVHQTDPFRDPRWARFVERHSKASVFHTLGWLEALRCTYGYEPVVYTTAAPEQELKSGLVFCRIKSWLTGSRMVSVPFADHCQPLVDNAEDFQLLATAVESDLGRERWKYIELRPLAGFDARPGDPNGFARTETFCFHKLDLRPDLEELFRSFHKSCIQRKIRKAEHEGLKYEEGRSDPILAKFYHLLLLTRRRHQLPPQPRAWFRNLIDCLGESLKIRVVSKDAQPIASILTLTYKNSLVYKYGCSDADFHNLGGIPLLFWKTIQEGKQMGAQEFDLGRSEFDNEGLIAFKAHWGAAGTVLNYYRYPHHPARNSAGDWKMHIVKRTFSRLPDLLLTTAGNLLYRHIG